MTQEPLLHQTGFADRERWLGYPKMTRAERDQRITVTLPRGDWWGLLVVAGSGPGVDPEHLGREAVAVIEHEVGFR